MTEAIQGNQAMTLGAAMQAMRAIEPEDMSTDAPDGMRQLLDQHDAVHVLFNLGTSVPDEIAAHLYLIFGTTANVRAMHQAIATQEHQQVLAGIGHFKLLGLWLLNLPRLMTIGLNCWKMKQKVPMEQLPELQTQLIQAIRQKYGIAI